MRLLDMLFWFLGEVFVILKFGIEGGYIYIWVMFNPCLLALLVSPKPIGTAHSAWSGA